MLFPRQRTRRRSTSSWIGPTWIIFFPSPGRSGLMRLTNFCAVKGRIKTASAISLSTFASFARIRMIGYFEFFSRMDWQMRKPVLLKEAALTTTMVGLIFSSRETATLPLVTVLTSKPFFCNSDAKEGMSAYRPSTTSREEMGIGWSLYIKERNNNYPIVKVSLIIHQS